MLNKIRLDIFLSENGLTKSREQAKTLINSGKVLVNNIAVSKPGMLISGDEDILVNNELLKYVSRGGYKLERAIEQFGIKLQGKTCCDIGASTGGFTDCMLQYGACKVFAIDVGHNQLDSTLLTDSRVINIEGQNFRNIDSKLIVETIDFASIDVSFISISLILPVLAKLLLKGAEVVSLIKPQFEAGRENLGKKGIVKDHKVHKQVIESVINHSLNSGFSVEDITYSPITGAEGNIEFLVYLKYKTSVTNCFSGDIADLIKQANKNLGEKH